MTKNNQHENLFENLDKEGLLVICAWCRKNKKVFNILEFHHKSKNRGLSHGICNKCSHDTVNSYVENKKHKKYKI